MDSVKTADDFLNDELADWMILILDNEPTFKEWIKDAMYSYGKYFHEKELKKLRSEQNVQVSDTTGDDSSNAADTKKHLDFITKEAQEMGLYD